MSLLTLPFAVFTTIASTRADSRLDQAESDYQSAVKEYNERLVQSPSLSADQKKKLREEIIAPKKKALDGAYAERMRPKRTDAKEVEDDEAPSSGAAAGTSAASAATPSDAKEATELSPSAGSPPANEVSPEGEQQIGEIRFEKKAKNIPGAKTTEKPLPPKPAHSPTFLFESHANTAISADSDGLSETNYDLRKTAPKKPSPSTGAAPAPAPAPSVDAGIR